MVSKPGSHPRLPAFKSFGRTSLKYEGFQVSWQPIYGYQGVGGRIHSPHGLGREKRGFHSQGLEYPEPSLPLSGLLTHSQHRAFGRGDDVSLDKSSLMGVGALPGCQSAAPGVLGDSGGILSSSRLSSAPTDACGPSSLGVYPWESRASPCPRTSTCTHRTTTRHPFPAPLRLGDAGRLSRGSSWGSR